MQKGGNRRLREHLERYGVDRSGRIAQKYNTKAAEYYRQLLRAEVHGEPPPLVLEVAQGNEPAFAPPPKPVEEQPPQFLSGGPPVQEHRPGIFVLKVTMFKQQKDQTGRVTSGFVG